MKNSIITNALFSLFITFPISAAYADIASDYQQGKTLFNQGQYQQSLVYFNKVRNQGLESPSLTYNLGSVHYKLEQYEEAEKYFLKLIDNSKTEALAYYNLGLISNKKGNITQAIVYFEKCQKSTNSLELNKLSTRQIKALIENNDNPWSGYFHADYGHDSNITSAPSGIASNQSGTFIQGSALANLLVNGTLDDGIVASASLFSKSYLDTSFNDSDTIALAVSLRDAIEDWDFSYTADVMQSTYGGADYQRAYRFALKAQKTLASNNRLLFRYRYDDINSLSPQFDHLDGSRQKLRAEYQLRWPADKVRIQLEHELNDRQNSATSNYSPTRNTLAIKYDKAINKNSTMGVETSYRNSDYEPATTLDREDDRVAAAFKYSYKLDKNWKINGKVHYRNNNSNDPALDYTKTVTTVSVSRFF